MELFKDRVIDNLDDRKRSMTVEDVLTMRTGLRWDDGDFAFMTEMVKSSDPIDFILNQPMACVPGTEFNYSSGASHLLSAMIETTSGMDTAAFAEEYLFNPLGIDNVMWHRDLSGRPFGGWGICLTPRQLARIGLLTLNRGVWEGSQIVSAKWIDRSVKKQAETSDHFQDYYEWYGYQWWLPDFGGYTSRGIGGQYCIVLPEYSMVIVLTGSVDFRELARTYAALVEGKILPATKGKKSLPANIDGEAQLREAIETAQGPGQFFDLRPLSANTERINGKKFIIDDDLHLWDFPIALKFVGDETFLVLYQDDGIQKIEIGRDNRYRYSTIKDFRFVTVFAAKGYWHNESVFSCVILNMQFPDKTHLRFNFIDNKVDCRIFNPVHGIFLEQQTSYIE